MFNAQLISRKHKFRKYRSFCHGNWL